jgi:uncharacterized protein YjiS (DUF1127 family)
MKGQKGYVLTQSLPATLGHPWHGMQAGWRQVRRWWQLAEERRQLATMDERMLKDIGLSRADVLQESARPFWDDPLKDERRP